jgi:hypothetical protein
MYCLSPYGQRDLGNRGLHSDPVDGASTFLWNVSKLLSVIFVKDVETTWIREPAKAFEESAEEIRL